jgi:hypothetical protein
MHHDDVPKAPIEILLALRRVAFAPYWCGTPSIRRRIISGSKTCCASPLTTASCRHFSRCCQLGSCLVSSGSRTRSLRTSASVLIVIKPGIEIGLGSCRDQPDNLCAMTLARGSLAVIAGRYNPTSTNTNLRYRGQADLVWVVGPLHNLGTPGDLSTLFKSPTCLSAAARPMRAMMPCCTGKGRTTRRVGSQLAAALKLCWHITPTGQISRGRNTRCS